MAAYNRPAANWVSIRGSIFASTPAMSVSHRAVVWKEWERTLLPLLVLALGVVGQFFLLLTLGSSILLRATLGHRLSILWEADKHVNRREDRHVMVCTYVSLVPLAEGGRIDLDDGVLDEGVRPDKLVVRGVVHLGRDTSSQQDWLRGYSKGQICSKRRYADEGNTHDTDDPRLAGNVLAAPGEVARVETESTVLEVTTADPNGVNALGAELGVGGLPTELELSLLAVVGTLGTGGRTLVPGRAGDTYELPKRRCKRQGF